MKKKLKSIAVSGIMGSGLVIPMTQMSTYASATIQEESVNANDVITNKFQPTITIKNGRSNDAPIETNIKVSGATMGEDVIIEQGVRQLINQNMGEDDSLIERWNNSNPAEAIEGPYDAVNYLEKVLNNKPYNGGSAEARDYGGNDFPTNIAGLNKTIYNHFRAGYRGANIYIKNKDVIRKKNFKIKIEYPAQATIYIPQKVNGHTEYTARDIDVTYEISEIEAGLGVPPKGYKIGGAVTDLVNPAFSTSWNAASGIKPQNVNSYRLDVKFTDRGNIVNENYLRTLGIEDVNPKMYFTFGSLNFYAQRGESAGMIDPPSGTKAYLSSDTHLHKSRYNSISNFEPKGTPKEIEFAKKYSLDKYSGSRFWYSEHTGTEIFTGNPALEKEANNFKDQLGARDYYKNAVTFEIPIQSSYSFLLGATAYDAMGDNSHDHKTWKPKKAPHWGYTNGWQFISTSPIFKTLNPNSGMPDPFAPVKTVIEGPNHKNGEVWITEKDSREITFKISQIVHKIGENYPTFYKSFIMRDVLPPELEILDAKIDCKERYVDGISNDLRIDKRNNTVEWNPKSSSILGSNEKNIRYGSMEMGGETYEMIIRARLKDGVTRDVVNTAQTIIDGQGYSSNKITIRPTSKPKVTIRKTVQSDFSINKAETSLTDSSDAERDTMIGKDNTYSIYMDIPKEVKTFNKIDIIDNLNKQLTFKEGSLKVELEKELDGPYEEFSDYKQEVSGGNINVTLSSPRAIENISKYKRLKVSFKAKLNEGTIPDQRVENKAKVHYTTTTKYEDTAESNSVFVYSQRAGDPDIHKDIEGNVGTYDAKRTGNIFTYNITSNLPENVSKYNKLYYEDIIDPRIKVIEKTDGTVDLGVKVRDKQSNESELRGYTARIDKSTNTLRVDITGLKELENKKSLKISFKSAVKNDVTSDAPIPNKATVNYRSPLVEGIKTTESNTVNVRINPSNIPQIDKFLVNKNADNNFTKKYEVSVGREVEYAITVDLPTNIETYKLLTIKDKLEDRLDYVPRSATVSADGISQDWIHPQYNEDTKTLSFRMEKPLESLKGKNKLTIKFKTKINSKAAGSQTPILNSAVLGYTTGTDDDKVENQKTVPVHTQEVVNKPNLTPKTEEQVVEIKKTMDVDKERNTVNVNQPFEYNLDVKLPEMIDQFKQFVITDKLNKLIDYVDFNSVAIDGVTVVSKKDAPDPHKDILEDKNNPISYDTRTKIVRFEVPAKKIKNLHGKTLRISFKAKASGIDANIPNVATVNYVDQNSNAKNADSNQVFTTVVGENQAKAFVLNKKINTGTEAELTKGEKMTFTLDTKLPENIRTYRNVTIIDKLDERISFADNEVSVTTDGNQLDSRYYDLSTDAGKLELRVNDPSVLGRNIIVKFKAKLNKELADNEVVTNTYSVVGTDSTGSTIGNEASNKTSIKHKNPNPFVLNKSVEGKNELAVTKGEKFTYALDTQLPENISEYRNITITDKLDDRLEFADSNVEVINDGQALNKKSYEVKMDKGKLEVLVRDTNTLGRNLIVKFKAKLNGDFTETQDIPNVYFVTGTDDNGKSIQSQSSNKVKVDLKAPSEVGGFRLNKTVNGKNRVTAKKDDVFTYRLDTKLPDNINEYKSITVSDKIDSRLKIESQSIKVISNGKQLDNTKYSLDIQNQKVNVKILNGENLKNNLVVEFDTKLLKDLDKTEKVPNIYGVEAIDGNGKTTNELSSNEVDVENPDTNSDKNNQTKPEETPKTNDTSGNNSGGKDSDVVVGKPAGNNLDIVGDQDHNPIKGERVKTGQEAVRSVMSMAAIGLSGTIAGAYAYLKRKKK